MKNSRISLLIIVVSLCLLTVACKPGVPRDIIQPDDMEKLLYDYHVSQAMASEGEGNMEYNERLYKLAVLKKHGVTEAEFDSSLVYYTRHTEQLHKIYQRLSERMNKEALALGASTDEVNRFTLTSTGDTANIWKGDINAALIPYAPYNVISFVIPADGEGPGGNCQPGFAKPKGSQGPVLASLLSLDSGAQDCNRITQDARERATALWRCCGGIWSQGPALACLALSPRSSQLWTDLCPCKIPLLKPYPTVGLFWETGPLKR